VPFEVSQRNLDRLEWGEVLARLAAHARTPRGREILVAKASGFATTLAEARQRQVETSEARGILDGDDVPPLDGVRDLSQLLPRLRKDGLLAGSELVEIGATSHSIVESARFLARHGEAAPGLAGYGLALPELERLAADIDTALDPSGEVLDSASPELARARRDSHQIAGEVQSRIARFLKDPGVRPHLQDEFFTVRGDRYVLPVRADAKSQIPGIVHDASSSGTTLFVEPQAVVDLNNKLKQAELTVERETRRVLKQLSDFASSHAEEIAEGLETLALVDAAFARGRLSSEMEASEPILDPDGVFELQQLRHPLLPNAETVPNDLRLGEGFHVLVISGPNAGGKTVAMKAIALAALFSRAGLHVPADPGARVGVVDRVVADIGDEQDLRESLSTFSAHMANLASIVADSDPRSLVVLDEIGVGTDPSEGAALAQSVLESLADRGARVVTTTHYNLLKEMAEVDDRFENASVEFDGETGAPTYRLKLGAAGASSATAVAARMGMPAEVLDRANALLEREDRRLDRMLTELSTSRAALERERSEATRLRAESEASRNEYRGKLERLQERRDKLFEEMRGDLDAAFKEAHGEVAGVIRDLQQKGTAQDAARAREKLLRLEDQARTAQDEQVRKTAPAPKRTMDWQRAHAGDTVGVPGGRAGKLITLPDRRGRVTVQVGGAKLTLTANQVTPGAVAAKTHKGPAATLVQVDDAPATSARVDLRGLRADEIDEPLAKTLDDAVRAGRGIVEVIHGVGTGALQKAVVLHLRSLPFVTRFEPAPAKEGGAGVTLVYLD
jgi:DNA mismatch repair protein MutS2